MTDTETAGLVERHWSVTVRLDGDEIVTIEPRMLAGKEIGTCEEIAIRTAAEHLLSFIGDPAIPERAAPVEDKEIEAIEARANAATPGPWDALGGSLVRAIKGDLAAPLFRSEAPIDWHKKKNVTHHVLCRAYADEVRNANFIANARTDIPRLLSRIRQLEAEVKEAREVSARKTLETCNTMSKGYTENEDASIGISNAAVYSVAAILGIGISEAINKCRTWNNEALKDTTSHD